jgi:hypothetical protein
MAYTRAVLLVLKRNKMPICRKSPLVMSQYVEKQFQSRMKTSHHTTFSNNHSDLSAWNQNDITRLLASKIAV